MGEIVGAALLSHVPTIVLPEAVRREINEGRESTLHSGLHELRRDVFDELKPDVVIVFDSHWFTTVEFVVTSADRRHGLFTSEELPRGMSSVPYDMAGCRSLAERIGEIADRTDECWISPIDNEHLPVTYATVNLLPFLQGHESWISVSVCQTAELRDFSTVGEVVAQAIADSDLRVVLVASGALSHTFHTLRSVRQHEAADISHIYSDAARTADERVLDALVRGDHAQVLDEMSEFARVKPEGHFAHYLMMVAALGGRECTAPGRMFSQYENAIGTGQAHVWFDRPADGWIKEHL
jgi:3,4-dihydroxyphenylacetate 2,3-dioxygenase